MRGMLVRRVRRTRGFTLLEVLMVIVIIGILATAVVLSLRGTESGAKIDMARNAVQSGFSTPLDLFHAHMGRYPTTEEGLIALLNRPDSEEAAEKWRGPYIKDAKMLKDPWGNDYVYVSPGQVNEDSYDLSSPGPNGRPGDDDDITNWKDTRR